MSTPAEDLNFRSPISGSYALTSMRRPHGVLPSELLARDGEDSR